MLEGISWGLGAVLAAAGLFTVIKLGIMMARAPRESGSPVGIDFVSKHPTRRNGGSRGIKAGQHALRIHILRGLLSSVLKGFCPWSGTDFGWEESSR